MLIDPNAWMLTLPLTAVLIWLAFEPQQSTVRGLWQEMTRCESEALTFLGLTRGEEGMQYSRLQRTMYLMVVIATAFASLASLAAALGLLPAAI